MLLLIGTLLLAAPFEVVVQTGHSKGASCVAYSPDGKLIATGGARDGYIKLWTPGGRLIRSIDTGYQAVFDLAFMPDGLSIVAADFYPIRERPGKAMRLFAVDGAPEAWLACESQEGPSKLAVARDGRIVANCGHKQAFVFSPAGEKLFELEGHTNDIRGVAFSPGGELVATANFDLKIRVFNGRGGKLLSTFELPRPKDAGPGFNPSWPERLSFSTDGKLIAATGDGVLAILTPEGKKVRAFFRPPPLFHGELEKATEVALSPDGKRVAVVAHEAYVYVWTLAGKPERIYSLTRPISTYGKPGDYSIESIAWSPDSRILAIAGNTPDRMVELRDVARDPGVVSLDGYAEAPPGRIIPNGSGEIVSLAASADGSRIATLDDLAWVRLWTGDGRVERMWQLPESNQPRSIAISADGSVIATSTNPYPNGAQLWTAEGQKGLRLSEHAPAGLAFSPGGRLGSSGGGAWNAQGTLIARGGYDAPKYDGSAVAISPDGLEVAGSADTNDQKVDTKVYLWRPDARIAGFQCPPHCLSETVRKLEVPGKVRALAYSPDGQTLAVAIGNGYFSGPLAGDTIFLFNRNGTRRGSLPGHPLYTGSLAFSPDGSVLAAGAPHTSGILLFKIGGGLLRELPGHKGGTQALFWPSKGKQLLSAGRRDHSVRMWNVSSGESVALLASGEQWITYADDGYFDASPDGGELVALVQGLEVYGVDQFALKYNRPDLLLQRLGFENQELIEHYRNQYKKRLRKAGITEEQLSADLKLPEASVVAGKQREREARVTLRCDGKGRALKRYNVFVNDVPLFAAPGKPLEGATAELTERIPLTAGGNKIEVSCTDEAGAESYRALTIADEPGTPSGDLWYLGFGVSKYRDDSLNLQYADKDARDLGALLSKMKKPFKSVHAKILTNEQVTVSAIKGAKAFLAKARPEDTLVLFIAGHGVHDRDAESTYYFLTHEADLASLQSTAANFEAVEDLLQGVAPRSKLFLMDTCESGEAESAVEARTLAAAGSRGLRSRGVKLSGAAGKAAAQAAPARRVWVLEKDRYIYNDVARRSGAIVFSSSRGGQYSYESEELKNGFFTSALLRALGTAEADANKDGTVSTGELRAFVGAAVSKATDGLQTPTVDRDNLFQRFGFPRTDR